jgi:hypothetical protein
MGHGIRRAVESAEYPFARKKQAGAGAAELR